jgi:hypothetical protein
MGLYAPEPTQDIHRHNGNARSGGDAGERLFRAGFAVREPVAADHDCDETSNLRDSAREKTLDSVKAGVERRALCHRGYRYEKKQGKNDGGWTNAFRPEKRVDLGDETNLGPTWHMHLRQHLKSAAFGAKLTSLNHDVQ